MADLFDLTGKIALVTGATGGLGAALVDALSQAGAHVVISDLDPERCASAAEALRQRGGSATALAADMALADSRAALVTALDRAGLRPDVLVCNAGLQGPAGPIAAVTDAEVDAVFEVNLRAAMDLTARLIPTMAERGGGSVVLMASIAGLRGNKAIGLYGLSKAALAQLARNLAVEWGPSNVRVNAVAPGLIHTPFAETLMENAAFMERRLGLTPLRRVGEPDEIAGVVVMLASRAGGFITGQTLVVDGGTTLSDGSL
ncbi:SDR family NAD(P)-dependent oxidoreductase [Pararhodobacter zhoushanensis]|uniref:Glucose 1-dehydrogenase n=1 Tax=Pararhodobacter zhoushanensis TaxID=2479545 RepID=A0ABT3H0B9_9RHOB|nr:glucose 1-dehydrogenase [Pararhodobacter zhoushanensis]MCW1933163.1 glucose 1-dehydrogenase [Pararhodobacter zhoushanensis]